MMRGLYLITNNDDFSLLIQKINVAFTTKQVALLQYRRKNLSLADQLYEIPIILECCKNYNIPLIINDNLKIAQRFGIGVHLGQNDGSIQYARMLLGEHTIIGRTCMNSLTLAEQAIADGASYVAFGAIYTSSSKETQVKNIGLELIQQAKQRFPNVPICTIGGLTVENSQPIIDAGANLCAVINDIFSLNIEHIPQRIQKWTELFSPVKNRE